MKSLLPAWAARYGLPQTLVFLGIWLMLMIGGRERLFSDPGTLWHLVAGQRMLSSGALIHTDPFSFTAAGEPWAPQSWLAECTLSLIHRLSGLDGILLATATLLACLYTWVFQRLLRAGLHPLLAAFLVALAILASSHHFHARPHLLTIALLGWTFALLSDFEAGRIGLLRLFGLPLLFVLWANLHGGMVGGIGTLMVVIVGWAIVYGLLWGGPLDHARQILWLSLLTAACGLAAFVNPYGAALLRVWFALIRSPVLPHLIQEHAPLWERAASAPAVLLFGSVYVAALLGVLPARPRITWLVPLLWLGFACLHVRHAPLFAITAVLALADMFPHVRWAKWLADKGSSLFRLRINGETETQIISNERVKPALVLGVFTAAILPLASCSLLLFGRNWAQLDHTKWPIDLLPELQKIEREVPAGTPIFNDMLFGGFLIYYTPALSVFIDDRCELYGDERLRAYARALYDDPAQIETWATQYGFDTALVQTGNALDIYLQHADAWKMIRRTQAATLYRRSVRAASKSNEYTGHD